MAAEKRELSLSIGAFQLLQFLLFLFMKLAGTGDVAGWSWPWVTSPLWVPMAFAAVLAGGVILPVSTCMCNSMAHLPIHSG